MRRRGRLAVGIVSISLGLVALIAGAALLATFGTDGAYDARSRLVTLSHGFIFDALSVGALPIDDVTLEVRASSAEPVFVGIADRTAVAAALDGVGLERIVRIDPNGPFGVEAIGGGRAPGNAIDSIPWAASAAGTDAVLTWTVAPGSWALVVLRDDGSAEVDATVAATLTVPGTGPAGVALAALGLALLVTGAVLTIGSSRPR